MEEKQKETEKASVEERREAERGVGKLTTCISIWTISALARELECTGLWTAGRCR